MFRWLPVFTVSLFVLVALASPARPVGAAEINANCTATFAQTANQAGVVNDWGAFGFPTFHLDGPLIQDQSWTLKGNPAINVGGNAEVGGKLSGFGFGSYLGTPTFVDFKGKLTFWDDSKAVPRGISGTYTIGPNGELPGGETTEISTYCLFDPPIQFADPDGDGIDSIVIVPGNFNLLGTGVLADGQNDLLLRTQAGAVQNITLGNTSDFTIEFDKFGPANAIVERSFNRTRTQVLGIFFPVSFVNIDLPVELSGSVVQSTLSGIYTGRLKTDAASTTILRDSSYSKGQVHPFPLINGTETTGPLTWKTRASNAIIDFNPITGGFNASVITELRSLNLAVAPDGPSAQGTILGDPLLFEEDIQGQFIPSATVPLIDNCPDVANPGQEDSDLDGNGDACDGLVWLDGNCNGLVDARDMLRTLLAASNVAVDPAPNCPQLGDAWGQRIGGDWDCNTTVNAADILYGLKEIGGIADPVPAGCPAPGELIPE